MNDQGQIEQNSDGSFSFPWGEMFWLNKVTGTASDCQVNKVRHSVATYTTHDSVSVSGHHDYNGNYVMGASVSVPRTHTRSLKHIDSEFWIRKADGKDLHFGFSQKVPPMLDGHRVTVVWGAKQGVESGKYKYIYNHSTGDGVVVNKSFSDLNINSVNRSVVMHAVQGFAATLLIALVLIIAGVGGSASLGGAGLLVLIVAIVMGYFVIKYRRINKVANTRANIMTAFMKEYVENNLRESP
ncbi:hypothetical protein [Acidithiobacillus ferriphilus]|jgi:hypothetical protein|uniref:hypothetical protein n=1 Tax=Acidithiobacillus ferriphilus TaxID=1689834 RepID=UPI001C06C20F|nr:hypothetical protein [Acidithiobacillus ferriphilus]MBU2831875.1 hypothetical protein [Acidithiobacillus ferriphilus]